MIKRCIFSCLCFVWLGILDSEGTENRIAQPEYDTLIQKADQASRVFDYAQSTEAYESALRLQYSIDLAVTLADNYFFWCLTLEKSLNKEQRCLQAQDILDTTLKIQPDHVEATARLARVFGQLALIRGINGKIKLGKQVFRLSEKVLKVSPNHPIANALLGIWHDARFNLPGITSFFAMLSGLPSGDLQTAKALLQKAVDVAPNEVYFRYRLARVLTQLNQQAAAKQQLVTLLALPNQNAYDKETKREAAILLSGRDPWELEDQL